MQLLDVIFIQRNVPPGIEDELRGLGISGDLLFVSRLERSQVQVRKQQIHFAIGESRALDSSRRTNGLHCRNLSQRRQPIRCKGTERLPGSFELVDLADKAEQVWSKDKVSEWIQRHTRNNTRKYPNAGLGIFGWEIGYCSSLSYIHDTKSYFRQEYGT
jgi:hypothetical protein